MDTDIYKSTSVPNVYLFVRSGTNTSCVPEYVLQEIGDLEFFKSITLTPSTPLIATDPNKVISKIEKSGYCLQGTAKIKESDVSEVGAAVGGGIFAASLGLGPLGAIAGAVIGAWLASQSKNEEEPK